MAVFLKFFQGSLDTGIIPDVWKMVKIMPVPFLKNNKPKESNDLHPMAADRLIPTFPVWEFQWDINIHFIRSTSLIVHCQPITGPPCIRLGKKVDISDFDACQ